MIKRPLVVFDMDGVLVTNRSSWRAVHEAVGTSNERSFQAYIRGEIDDDEFMERDILLWKVKGLIERSRLKDILDGINLMKGLERCIEELRGSGCEIAIISGGLDLLANRIGEEFGITRIAANGVEFDENDHLTGRGILHVPLRDKGSILRKMIRENDGAFSPIIAVGDSPVDITMFREADLSIGFLPENDDVIAYADQVVNDPDLGKVSKIINEWLKEEGSG